MKKAEWGDLIKFKKELELQQKETTASTTIAIDWRGKL